MIHVAMNREKKIKTGSVRLCQVAPSRSSTLCVFLFYLCLAHSTHACVRMPVSVYMSTKKM